MKRMIENTLDEAGKVGASKAVDLLVEKFIIPKLENIINRPKDIFILRDLFNEYLDKKYKSDQYMNTIAFQHETKTIDDLYIPLTITQNGKRNSITINKKMKNIFVGLNRILVIDTAGTGKSTLVKFLSTLCVKSEWGIPFVIELRRLEKKQSIISYIIKEIQLSNDNISDVDVKDLIRRGDFIFFFDGYDEILEVNKEHITKEIREFVKYAGDNNFVMTSREDDCLSEFADFTKYHIRPLKKNEAYELIRKYDNYGELSQNLIEEIEKDENYHALKEFLGNPLMVSLLYLTYRYKGVLQYKKHIFYRQVFDALYDRHDAIKGVGAIHEKKSELDIEDFRRVLCAMGFISMKTGRVEYEKDQVIDVIKQAINVFPEIEANENDFLQDILHTVPLFVEEGIKYKWAHKSFAEYFASIFICKECKEYQNKVLSEILESDKNKRFFNMLDFCYDIDYKAVVENLAYPILTKYVSFYDNMKETENGIELWEEKIFHEFISTIYLIKIDDKVRPKGREIIKDFFAALNILEREGIDNFTYMSCLSKGENIMIATQRNNTNTIIKLLFQKGMDVFKEIKVKSYSLKFLKSIEKIGVYNIFGKNCNDPWLINNKDAMVSVIHHNDSEYRGHILDVEKCRKQIKEIDMLKSKVTDDFFSLN